MTDKKTKGWKNAALGAMVFLTGLSSSLNAAAQKTTERDPQKDKTEILHSPQSAEDAYWEKYYNGEGTFAKVYSAGEEPGPAVRFSSKELARALVGADLSEEQQKVFVKAYANSINDDMEITPEALRIVMERARFSKDQALKFKNALFAERENPEKTEDQYKDLEYHRGNRRQCKRPLCFRSKRQSADRRQYIARHQPAFAGSAKTAQRHLQMRHRGQRKHELCQKH